MKRPESNKQKRGNLRCFGRSFVITLLICLCPIILLLGVAVADRNTRMASATTDRPAVTVHHDGDRLAVTIFGYGTSIPLGFLHYAGPAVKAVLPYIPPEIRLAFSGIRALFSPDAGGADG